MRSGANLGPSPTGSELRSGWSRRDTVKKTLGRCLVVIVALTAIGTIVTQNAWGQTTRNEQCSLAVVSRLVPGSSPVCDAATVQQMAKRGHAFEQNQMGMASILAIGPDYSEKEAFAWFERAAQRGFAPAQVNLAVMYSNGWGTPVNYGAALRWFRAAADQHFARAYFNLGILYLEGTGVRQ